MNLWSDLPISFWGGGWGGELERTTGIFLAWF